MASDTMEGQVRAAATARMPGYDVARAIAIFGMVQVNFESMMHLEKHAEPAWLNWATERIEGRSAALFVMLAGVGIALRTRKARETGVYREERVALLKRAAVLFVVGLLNVHLWEWDILHFYGLYLGLAALLLGARSRTLAVWTGACVAAAAYFQLEFSYDLELELWSWPGMLLDLVFSGVHPVFPWMAFLTLGMILGRVDLRERETRRRVFTLGLAAAALGELADTMVRRAPDVLDYDSDTLQLMFGWPRPPSPAFVLAAAGTSVCVICLLIGVTEPRPTSRWVVALMATGQLAFTLYVAHTLAILLPIEHGYFAHADLLDALGYAFAFNLVAVFVSLWWRRRWSHGPLEALIRQLSGRTEPAPWGGALLR